MTQVPVLERLLDLPRIAEVRARCAMDDTKNKGLAFERSQNAEKRVDDAVKPIIVDSGNGWPLDCPVEGMDFPYDWGSFRWHLKANSTGSGSGNNEQAADNKGDELSVVRIGRTERFRFFSIFGNRSRNARKRVP